MSQAAVKDGLAKQHACQGTTAPSKTVGTLSAFQARVSDPTYANYTLH